MHLKKNKKKIKKLYVFFQLNIFIISVCCEENHIKFLDYVKNFANKKKYQIILRPKYKSYNSNIGLSMKFIKE